MKFKKILKSRDKTYTKILKHCLIDMEKIKSPVIINIGAYYGNFVTAILKTHDNYLIYAIEPSPKSFKILKKRFKKDKKIITINAAVSDKNGKLPFYNAGGKKCDSLVKKFTKGKKETVTKTIVKTITTRSLFEKYKIKKVDLLKINCEGGEYALFDDCEYLDNVNNVCIEFHNSPEFGKIREKRSGIIKILEKDFTLQVGVIDSVGIDIIPQYWKRKPC